MSVVVGAQGLKLVHQRVEEMRLPLEDIVAGKVELDLGTEADLEAHQEDKSDQELEMVGIAKQEICLAVGMEPVGIAEDSLVPVQVVGSKECKLICDILQY
jgi:hypothetical protein